MKSFMIAMAAAASLAGATFISAEASAKPGGSGGYKSSGFKSGGGYKASSYRPGGYRPGRVRPGHFPGGFRPGGHHRPGIWAGPHWGHGHGYRPSRVHYFARPIYVGAYEACNWVRIHTRHGLRWRAYC